MSESPSLSSYLVFNTVARSGNLSSAAKELLISQPAVSRSLSKLEDSLSVKLFIRTSRGVRLTSEGEFLYARTRDAFTSLQNAEKSIRHIKELKLGHLRVGVSNSLYRFLLTDRLKSFLRLHPGFKIDLSLSTSGQVFDLVENGITDIGLICRPQSLHRLEYIELIQLHDIFAASPAYIESLEASFPPGKKNPVSTGNLLLPEKDNDTRRRFNSLLSASNVTPFKITECKSPESAIDLALSGLGIIGIPKEFIKKELDSGELVRIPFSSNITSAGLVYEKTSLQSESVEAFLELYK